MSRSTSQMLVQEYLEKVWNQADLEAFKSLTLPTFTYTIGEQAPRSIQDMEQFLLATHQAFPDWRVNIVDIIAEENRVAIRWQGQVTHQGNFNGIPATGRSIFVSGINIYHIENGKIASEWEQTDTVSMLKQLGLDFNIFCSKPL